MGIANWFKGMAKAIADGERHHQEMVRKHNERHEAAVNQVARREIAVEFYDRPPHIVRLTAHGFTLGPYAHGSLNCVFTPEEELDDATAKRLADISRDGITVAAVHYPPHRISHMQVGPIRLEEVA